MHSKVVGVVGFAAVGAILFGIDCSNVGSALIKPGFIDDFCAKKSWPTSAWPRGASCNPSNDKECNPLEDCHDATTQPFGYTNFVGLLSSLICLGSAFGALLLAPPAARWGRRQCMFIGAAITVIGIIPQCIAKGFVFFLVARFVLGIGVGMITYALPIYISEVAPASVRGAFGVSFQLILMMGAFGASAILASGNMSYKIAFLMPAIPAIILMTGIFFLPPSPREALVKALQPDMSDTERNKLLQRAQNAMRRLRDSQEEADQEFEELRESLASQLNVAPWSKLWTDKSVLRRVRVANMLQWFQQFSGMNCLMVYGPEIYQGAGVPIGGLTANVFTTGANLAGTVVMMFLIDRWGRKTLFQITTSSMCVFMAISGVLAWLSGKTGNETFGWALLVGVCLSNVAFALGWGGGAWVYPSEIFPMDVKEKALATSVWSQYFGNFCLNYSSSWLIKGVGYANTFYVFAAINVVGFILCSCMVKETKGKTLEEVGVLFGETPKKALLSDKMSETN